MNPKGDKKNKQKNLLVGNFCFIKVEHFEKYKRYKKKHSSEPNPSDRAEHFDT